MAITLDYVNKIINIPRTDLQIVQSTPTEIRQLDIDVFRLILRDLEDDPNAMPFDITHDHVAPKQIGGVTLARVIEIINDYTVTFEDGQYAVNIVGGNSNIADRVNVNQVSVRSANSAGLTSSKQNEDQAFRDSRVFIQTIEGLPGSIYPRGTEADPVNNLPDSQLIIENRNLPKRLFLVGSITVTNSETVTAYDIEGENFAQSVLNLDSGASSDNLIAKRLWIQDSVLGNLGNFEECLLADNSLNGFVRKCKLGGIITITEDTDIVECYGTVILIIGVPGITINVINFSGSITIANMTSSDDNIVIACFSAIVTLDASCIDGEILIGDGDLVIDNSGSGCEVTQINKHDITHAGLLTLQSAIEAVDSKTTDLHRENGSDPDNPAQLVQNNQNSADLTVAGKTKQYRKIGNTTTITTLP